MENKIIIASDSTCDLSPELLSQYHILTLPFGIALGDNLYLDGVTIGPEFIYQHYAETGELPKTSAINIDQFVSFFREHTADGSQIVFFTISSEMSSTYQNACIAAEEVGKVFVVDTRSLSTGGGLLVVKAAELAQGGASAKEIAEYCTEMAYRIDASFIVDDLEFLHKGGRCSAVAALGSNLLKIKPCIIVKNGKMTVGKKYRGSFSSVLEKYIGEKLENLDSLDLERAFITHGGCEDAVCQSCIKMAKELAPFQEVLLTRAGCTISSHCGRNTLGILLVRKERMN